MGTSIELDKYASRADLLRKISAAVRFISAEPLLGPLPSLNLDGIDWLIVGGESGRSRDKVRPMSVDWARDLRDRSIAAGTAYFFKQWGNWNSRGEWCRSKADAGRDLDGRTWDEMPKPGSTERVIKVEALPITWGSIEAFRADLAGEHIAEAGVAPTIDGRSTDDRPASPSGSPSGAS